jgi:hypothetical protein
MERTLRCDLKTKVNFVMPAKRTSKCNLNTQVEFVPRGADFDMRHENRRQLCAARSGLKMQK